MKVRAPGDKQSFIDTYLISQPITKPYLKGRYPIAEYIGDKGILLPIHQYLKKEDLNYLVKTIQDFYANT
jgi:dTDP-4-amino-4,6-dideoxygalactose transaminase